MESKSWRSSLNLCFTHGHEFKEHNVRQEIQAQAMSKVGKIVHTFLVLQKNNFFPQFSPCSKLQQALEKILIPQMQ